MLKVCRTLYGQQKLIPEERLVPRSSAYGIIRKDKHILLVNTKSTNKFWFPGGVVDKGETPEEALKREVYEETGLIVTKSTLLTTVESYFYYNPQDMAFCQHSLFYLCNVKSYKIPSIKNPDKDDEAEKPRWIGLSSLSKNDFQDYGFQIFSMLQKSKNLAGTLTTKV